MLEIDDLTAGYGGPRVLKGTGLTVREGERVALLGANGAGKTTLFRCILGLLAPVSGAAKVRGHEALHDRATALRHVGVMWDDEVALPSATPADLIRWFAQLDGLPRSRVDETLRSRGLWPLRNRALETLSHGQRRRVELSLAMIRDPSFLLLDEPTTGLDLASKEVLWEELSDVPAMLLATHDPTEVLATATRVVVLRDGVIAHDGPCAAFKEMAFDEARRRLTSLVGPATAPTSPNHHTL